MAFFCEFSMATRSFNGINTSEDRVITVFNCDSRKLRSRRWATSRATIFSGGPYRRYAPLSFPPCPASTTTVVKVLLVSLIAVLGTVVQAANEATKVTVTARFTRLDIRSHLILKNAFSTKSFAPANLGHAFVIALNQLSIFGDCIQKPLVFCATTLKAFTSFYDSICDFPSAPGAQPFDVQKTGNRGRQFSAGDFIAS